MNDPTTVISLCPVTQENFRKVIGLKVREDQKGFVATNAESLAEAYVFPFRHPLAIYADETPIGFLMYVYLEERRQHWIFRLMIAAENQRRGYGRTAMRLLIERMRAIQGCNQIYISYELENEVARKLYGSLGFRISGEIFEGEEVARLDLP